MPEKRCNPASDICLEIAAPCGVCCQLCEFYESESGLTCGGCLDDRLCRVDEVDCLFVRCTAKHGVEHCGLCEEFPCRELYDAHVACSRATPQIAVFRIGDLALRAQMGTARWLQEKLSGSLPEVWELKAKADLGPQREERRRYRRTEGRWTVKVSFSPAPVAFGLNSVEALCPNASPIGMLLLLPPSIREGFGALVRTKRTIEVVGEFPSTLGSFPFSGETVWHDFEETRAGESTRVGVLFDTVRNEPVIL
jgi:hypothetical protein